MGLFKKKEKNTVAVAAKIEIRPEYFIKIREKEYSIGMKVRNFLGFDFLFR